MPRELVRLVVQGYESVEVDRVWSLTVPDLFLLLTKPDGGMTTSNRSEQIMMCLMIDERRELLAKLTVEQRVELERLKAEMM